MTAEVSDIAKQLEEASPLLAASIWTRIALAKKLAESQNKHF